jgi:hypothetical protein
MILLICAIIHTHSRYVRKVTIKQQ